MRTEVERVELKERSCPGREERDEGRAGREKRTIRQDNKCH